MNTRIKHLISSVFVTGLILGGCGTDTSPVASNQDAAQPSARLHFFDAQHSAAKIAAIPAEGLSNSKTFKSNGSQMKVQDKNEAGVPEDDLTVSFSILPGAVTEDVVITMTAYGNALSEMVVAFEPGGLDFLVDAVLELDLGDDLVDLDLSTLQILHEHSDGSVEIATILSIDDNGPNAVIRIAVPGFSRYSGGGGT